MFKNFEDIHKNHKWAFTDGVLCGIVLAWIGKLWYDAWRLGTPPKFEETAPEDPNETYHLSEYAEKR